MTPLPLSTPPVAPPPARPLTRRRFLRHLAMATAAAAVAGPGGGWLQNHRCVARPLTLRLPGLPPQWVGRRAVFLSDTHLHDDGPWPDSVARAVELATAWDPDLVMWGGDLWDRPAGAAAAQRLMRALPGRLGSWYVPGNWEYSASGSVARIRDVVAETPAVWVAETSHTLDGLRVVGMDDLRLGRPAIPQAARALAEGPSLLLCHEPGQVHTLPPGTRASQILAGHTHGGQVCWWPDRPLWLPDGSGGFVAGAYDTPAGPLFVGRGAGALVPLRWMTTAEVLLITFAPSSDPAPVG